MYELVGKSVGSPIDTLAVLDKDFIIPFCNSGCNQTEN